MAGIVRLNPKIVNLKPETMKYFEGLVLEPVQDSFPSTGKIR